jgi:hypothetical protein
MHEAGPHPIRFSGLLHEGGPIAHLGVLFDEAYEAGRVAVERQDDRGIAASIAMMNRVNAAMTLFPDQRAGDAEIRATAAGWRLDMGSRVISSGVSA